MKIFIISVALFFILISAILINAIYINKEIDRLIDGAEALGALDSPDFSERLSELEENWYKFRKVADISCAYSELNKIDTTFHLLAAYAETKSTIDYEATRATLIDLLLELSRLEKITLEGLI